MSCDCCLDLKIYYENMGKWERKTYVCGIDTHSSKTIEELEETCPHLEIE